MRETEGCTGARHVRRFSSTLRPHPTYEAVVLRDLPRLHCTALLPTPTGTFRHCAGATYACGSSSIAHTRGFRKALLYVLRAAWFMVHRMFLSLASLSFPPRFSGMIHSASA
jgi:hypothetical protein